MILDQRYLADAIGVALSWSRRMGGVSPWRRGTWNFVSIEPQSPRHVLAMPCSSMERGAAHRPNTL